MKKFQFCTILCFQCVFFVAKSQTNSLFAEQLQLSPFETASKALNLARQAEKELNKGTTESVQLAITYLELAMQDSSFRRLNTENRIHLALLLCRAYQQDGSFEKEEKLFQFLVTNKTYEPYWILLRTKFADAYLYQGRFQDADEQLKKLLELNIKDLAQKDREEIAQLVERISTSYQKQIAQGLLAYTTENYQEAITIWNRVLSAIQRQCFPLSTSISAKNELLSELCYRIALSYQKLGNWEKVESTLQAKPEACNPANPDLQRICAHSNFLQGYASLQLKKYNVSRDCLEKALRIGLDDPYEIEAQLLLARIYLAEGNTEKTISKLQKALQNPKNTYIYTKALALLIQAEINNESYDQAYQLIEEIEQRPENDESLLNEVAYLKGKLFYALHNYEQATLFFEKAIAENTSSSYWNQECLLLLDYCYLNLAMNEADFPLYERIAFLERAQVIGEQLSTVFHSEEGRLALAYTFIIRNKQTSDDTWKIKALEVLEDSSWLHKEENALYRALFIGSLLPGIEEKRTHYDAARSMFTSQYSKTILAYNKCIDELTYLKSSQQTMHLEDSILEQIQETFTHDTFTTHDNPGLNLLRLNLAYHLLAFGEPKAQELAIALIKNIHNASDAAMQEKIQMLLCYAQANRAMLIREPSLLTQAEISISQFLQDYPQSSFCPSLLHLGATLYITEEDGKKAFDTLNTLISTYTTYPYLDEALFLAAECAERAYQRPDQAKKLRKQLVKTYPASFRAACSFFRYFPEKEYISSNKGAIRHLKKITPQMLQSYYAIPCYFYIGSSLKQESAQKKSLPEYTEILQDSLSRFDIAIELYKERKKHNEIPQHLEDTFLKLFYNSKLLKSRILALLAAASPKNISYYENCESDLKNLINEVIEGTTLSAPSTNTLSTFYYNIVQEAAFRRAKALDALGKANEAEEQLLWLITVQHSLNMPINEFFIRSHYTLADLSSRKENYETVKEHISRAKALQSNGYPRELLLEIWMTESECYKRMKKLDNAMMLLSQIINDDCVSSIRIQAMYMRAEIYQLQHRHDLAIKQLEATQRMGGEWALKAKQKLEELYGYE